MTYIIYFIVIALCGYEIFLGIQFIEYSYCVFIKSQAPFVPSAKKSRKITLNEIKKHYPNAKNIIEVGSGFGAFSRQIARDTKANVIGLENMPWCAFVSKILDIFCFKKAKTVFCDAFEYLENTDKKFDIAIAYLGPKLTPKLLKYKNKIKVLIVLDFPLPDYKPTRTIDGGSGTTKMGGKKYPHKLYIYEFKRD